MKVVIVEDNARYRDGLETLISRTEGFELAAVFPGAVQAVAAAEEQVSTAGALEWDLALLDIDMPHMNGIEGTQRLKALCPEIKIVMLTVFEEPASILEAICAGADGYMLKKTSARELIRQVRQVAEGGAPLTSGVARTVLSLLRQNHEPVTPRKTRSAALTLTEREQEVLRCLVNGRTYKGVAEDLGISIDTVRSHVKRLYRKLQVHSVAEAVTKAIRERMV